MRIQIHLTENSIPNIFGHIREAFGNIAGNMDELYGSFTLHSHCIQRTFTVGKTSKYNRVWELHTFVSELGHSISYKIACAPSEDSDQSAFQHGLSKVFAVRSLCS